MADPVFLPWDRPFLPQVAGWLVGQYGNEGEVDLGQVTVVVPGRRSGRRLLELLVERAEEGSAGLVPPREILTVGRLPERLYRPPRPLATPLQARRAWFRVLEEVPPGRLEILFHRPGAREEPGAREKLARLLDSLHREVGASGRTFREVADLCHRELLFDDQDRWLLLAELQEAHGRVLARCGRMDREEARRRALGEGELSFSGTLVLVGVAELPGLLREMLLALGDRVTPLVHAPEALREAFRKLGDLRGEVWLDRTLSLPPGAVRAEDRPPDQATAVLEELHGFGGAYAPGEITLGVTRDEELVPFLEQRLSAYGCPHRYAGGFPLKSTGPFRLLAAAGEVLDDGRFHALAELLRHPQLLEYMEDFSIPELADDYFTRHLSYRISAPTELDARDLPRQDVSLGRRLRVLYGPDLLGPLQGQRHLSDWMPRILELLVSVYGGRRWSRQVPQEERVVEACARIRTGAQEIHELPRALDHRCSADEAIRILLDELRDETLPPPGREDALEIVGWLELPMDDAPALILTGVNDPHLPEALNAHPFLPNALRTRLGLEDNESRFARDLYRLTAMVESRRPRDGGRAGGGGQVPPPCLRLVAGRRTLSGDPLRPSRLLLLEPGEAMPRRLLEFLDVPEEEGEGAERRIPPLGLLPAPRSAFSLPPEPAISLSTLPQPLPVTDFRALLADPYLWALERIRGLREMTDDALEMDPLLFGTLAHRVLELFGEAPEARSSDPDAVERGLNGILDRVVRAWFGPDPLPTVPIQVEHLRLRLKSFARWQAERVDEGWEIYRTEARTPREGVAFPVDDAPVFLSGRIDRIDRNRRTGAWAVLDYKTGEEARDPARTHGRKGAWKDLQLPLYRFLLDHLQDPEGRPLARPDPGAPVTLGYLCLAKRGREEIYRPAPWDEEEVADALETARQVLRRLRAQGEIRFDPQASGKNARGLLAVLLGRGLLMEPADGGEEEE